MIDQTIVSGMTWVFTFAGFLAIAGTVSVVSRSRIGIVTTLVLALAFMV